MKQSKEGRLRLEWVEAGSLQANPDNWRKHPAHQVAALRESIADVGWAGALLFNERTHRLIDGHARRDNAEPTELVPVLVGHWDAKQERRILATLDPITALAEPDPEALGKLLDGLTFDGEALAKLGQDLAREIVLPAIQADIIDTAIPERPKKAIGKPGDLWTLGEHRVLCGDATKSDDVAKLLDGGEPFIMVTDPPYGVEYDADRRNAVDTGFAARAIGKVTNDDMASWRGVWRGFTGSVAYVWHACTFCAVVLEDLVSVGLEVRNQIIWRKARFVAAPYGINIEQVVRYGLYHWQHETCWYLVRTGASARWAGDRSQSTIWDIGHTKNETGHSTQKPIECMARPIRNHGGKGDDVFDPFLGSGTTVIAAEQLGRKCYGLEIDPKYCDVIIERWQNLTGGKAKRVKA